MCERRGDGNRSHYRARDGLRVQGHGQQPGDRANLRTPLRSARHDNARSSPGTPTGSTDMGDISHAIPAIHPLFQVSNRGEGTCHEDALSSTAIRNAAMWR